MISFSPKQLEVFVAITLQGSVKAAAKVLHLTQPAASMALAELEKQLGSPLFDRDKGRLFLNQKGKDLLPLAQEILERMRELEQRAGDAQDTLRGNFRVGASNTVGNYLVGDLLGNFVNRHEAVTVHLQVANSDEIVKGIMEHSLDVACIEGEVINQDIEALAWRDDQLQICARPDHPLALKTALQESDFENQRWILREQGSATRLLCERELARLPQGHIVMELGQVEAIKQAVIAGLGIAFLPKVAVTYAIESGRLKRLETPFLNLNRKLSIIYHKQRYRGRLMDNFLSMAGI